MNILVLAHFYPPEMGGAGARLHGLSRWLAHAGHNVTVITGFPNYPSGVIPEAYKGKLRQREEMDGVDVVRTWVFASPKRGSIRRMANYFSFVFSSIITGLLLRKSYDVVLVSSPPLFIGLAGWVLAGFRRIPFVFDIRDLWPEIAVETGEFSADSRLVKMADALARFLYRKAAHITPVTENKLRKIEALGVPENKMTVVTNGVDLDLLPSVTEDKRAELGLEGKFVAVYAGLLGIAQGVEMLVHSATRLREHEDLHFLIIGDGVRREAIAEEIERQGLTNVTMLPRQPREQISHYLASADVSLVPLINSELTDAVPSKLLEAWAHRCTPVLIAGGEAASLVRRCQGGIVAAPEQPEALDAALLALKADPERLARHAHNGHEFVRRHFDRAALARQMEEVLEQVTEPQSTYRRTRKHKDALSKAR